MSPTTKKKTGALKKGGFSDAAPAFIPRVAKEVNMPDMMITAADVAKMDAKPLKVLLREYRKTYREFGEGLAALDDKALDVGVGAYLAASKAAAAPNDRAREAMIEAPAASLEDIKTKLRFYFEVGGGNVDRSSWESRIVANILRDIGKPQLSSLRILRQQCKEAFRASTEATEAADNEMFRVRKLHPPCPERLLVEWTSESGCVHRKPATSEDLIVLRDSGELTAEDAQQRIEELREWEAACDVIDAQHPTVQALRDADEAAEARWKELDEQLVAAPARTLDDVRVKLEFLATMEDFSDEPGAMYPDRLVFGLIRDIASLKISESAVSTRRSFPACSASTRSYDGLVDRVASAIGPLLVEDDVMGHRFADGRAEIDAYRALLAIFGDFTVSDAVKASDILCKAQRPLLASGTDPLRYGALWEAFGILEHFIAAGRPSSFECVAALAEHLAVIEEDGEQRMFEVLRLLAATTLGEGFASWRSNDFSNGERFSAGGDGNGGWCERAIKAGGREAWWWAPTSGA